MARWFNPPTPGSVFHRRLELTDLDSLPIDDAKQALASLVGAIRTPRADWAAVATRGLDDAQVEDSEDSFEEA